MNATESFSMIINFITRFFRCLSRTDPVLRIEFLLPLKQNDDTPIDPTLFDQTSMELTDRFEGLSQDLIRVHGIWKFAGTEYKDELIRFRVDTRHPRARAFFKAHKEIWKARFRQIDIWITLHEIEVI
jgi:hypothetical protein